MARQKGTKNRKTLEVEEIASKLKCNPFEVLCLFAKGDWKALGYENELYFIEKPDGQVKMGYVVTPEMRLQGAKEAAKYLYSQKRAVEVGNTKDEGFKIIVEGYPGEKK